MALIAAISYVRVVLTGGINDPEDRLAGLGLNNFNLGLISNAFPLCISHVYNEMDKHESRNQPITH